MGIDYEKLAVVVNRVKEEAPPQGLDELAGELGADVLVTFPEDLDLAKLDAAGKSLQNLPEDNPLVKGMDSLLDRLDIPRADS
jgi:CO dehydrogenase nickel-insertion accessory protein CooC1